MEFLSGIAAVFAALGQWPAFQAPVVPSHLGFGKPPCVRPALHPLESSVGWLRCARSFVYRCLGGFRLASKVVAQRGAAVRSGSSVPNKSLEPTPVRDALTQRS